MWCTVEDLGNIIVCHLSSYLLPDSKFKCNSSFRIFWNVFNSENGIQKRHFDSSQNCIKTEQKITSLFLYFLQNLLIKSGDITYLFLLSLQTSPILQKAESFLPYHQWVFGSGIPWRAAYCLSWNWTSTWAQCQKLEEQQYFYMFKYGMFT